jgi:hypothetical protein
MALAAAIRSPWVEGSTGQPKAHPGFDVAATHDELALRLHRELQELRQRRAKDDLIKEAQELTLR